MTQQITTCVPSIRRRGSQWRYAHRAGVFQKANTVVVEIGGGNYTLHHKWHRKLHYQVHYGLLHVYLALYVAEANDDMHIAREFFGEPAHRCSGVGGRDRVEGVEENVHRFWSRGQEKCFLESLGEWEIHAGNLQRRFVESLVPILNSQLTAQWTHNMGWLRLLGSLKLWVSFAEYGLFYRALLQKRRVIS